MSSLIEFETFALQYLEVYFGERDLNQTLYMFDKRMTVFGTGLDEIGYELQDTIDLYRRDITSIPNQIEYEILHNKTIMLTPDVAVFICQLNITVDIEGNLLNLNQLRETLVLTKIEDEIKISHKHISFPTIEHEEGEAYPLKEFQDIKEKVDAQVKENTITIMEAYRQLENAVVYDPLTSLFNRNRIDDLITQEISRAARYDVTFSIILFDINNFKLINDTHGHLFGDSILKKFAEIIKLKIRETDSASRWGGDEFLVLFPETSRNDCFFVVESIEEACQKVTKEGNKILSVSFGVATYQKGDTLESIFHRADIDLYNSKELKK